MNTWLTGHVVGSAPTIPATELPSCCHLKGWAILLDVAWFAAVEFGSRTKLSVCWMKVERSMFEESIYSSSTVHLLTFDIVLTTRNITWYVQCGLYFGCLPQASSANHWSMIRISKSLWLPVTHWATLSLLSRFKSRTSFYFKSLLASCHFIITSKIPWHVMAPF